MRLFIGSCLLIACGYAVYYWRVASRYESTDNAYVGADSALITPQVGGPVAQVLVEDVQQVKRGDVLVVLDPSDAQLAVALREAEYAQTVRRVRQYVSNERAASAQVTVSEADLARSQAEIASMQSTLARASADLKRVQALAAHDAVSDETVTNIRNAYEVAVASLRASKAAQAQAQASRAVALDQHASTAALIEGSDVDTHPEVQSARAALDKARLDLERTVIKAPIDGQVIRRRVQVGQRVEPGAQLMTLVPLQQVYVDANFKESQLARMAPAQKVELVSDQYGGAVVYHGRIVDLGAGTGSAFAVIPAQNATGNWIKVVQRVPVRIALDPLELAEHPLRVGLSMEVEVDVSSVPQRETEPKLSKVER